MIICFGPFCIPIWHLGIVALLFVRPIADFLLGLCGRRSPQQGVTTTPAENSTAPGIDRGTASSLGDQDTHTGLRRRERGVISVRSERELETLKAEAEAAGLPLFLDFKATCSLVGRQSRCLFDEVAVQPSASSGSWWLSVGLRCCSAFPVVTRAYSPPWTLTNVATSLTCHQRFRPSGSSSRAKES
ncbi:hypothetical protein Efla_005057 [Eimeria flavescens]